MTIAAQLRLTDRFRKVFDIDKAAATSAPAAMTVGARPSDMIHIDTGSQQLSLMCYGQTLEDNPVAIVDLWGVFAGGSRYHGSDSIYFSYLLRSGIVFTMADGAAASGGLGFIPDDFVFADTVTAGSAGALDTALAAIAGVNYDTVILSPADDDTPAILTIGGGFGPLVGIVPRVQYMDTDITALNFLKSVWS